jgi:site-specific DNA recombinase
MSDVNKRPKEIRCAIYTRKSTTEGLEQEFNTLDAQREACSAYIASQRHEGWFEIDKYYDDGGFTGGNMERPALKQLMDDITAKKVDCVVVYKVDRLSRSLMDFSRIMDVLDKTGVSFVSITQQFNTTSSMGRLTLNILLSFAQFEREIISERTRDKMSAARRKGKYIGGRPVLGYDLNRETKKLIVNEMEAERVRQIFDLYLESEGLLGTMQAIEARGWRTKHWITTAGKPLGGGPFGKTSLHALLTNPVYLGKVTYHDEIYEGEHDAIVDPKVFAAVKKKLRDARVGFGDRIHGQSLGVLAGLLRCTSCDAMMTHSTSGGSGRGKRYRYYVCNTASKRGHQTCPRPSLPAEQIERFVVSQLQALTIDEALLNETCLRVSRSVSDRGENLEKELALLNESLRNAERVIEALSTPTGETGREVKRLASLASLTEQQSRDIRRRNDLQDELARIHSAAPDRSTIMAAIKNLEPLWDHLTVGERSRLMTRLVERIDHDPVASNLSITLSPTGLKSFNAELSAQTTSTNPNSTSA